MPDDADTNKDAQEIEDERAVSTVPLETEDGGTVVISQQNVGPGNQVGGGEYKRAGAGKTSDQAAAEQEELQADAPVATGDTDE